MNRTALTAAALATTLLCVGSSLAQAPGAASLTSIGRETNFVSPEDVLSIRDVRELQVSPDGKQIAFKVTEPADPKLPRTPRTSNIWIVPTDGSKPPRPCVPNLKNAMSPRWSPDGRSLAFLSDRGESGIDPDTTIQIYLLPSDGGKAERLTSVGGGVEDFAWSPDSKTIAFVARDQPTAREQERESAGDDATEVDRNFKSSRLWIANLSDRKAVQITKQDFEINELAWSPKGDEIALVVARTQKPEDSLLLSLVVVNRSTGEVARTLSTNVAPISGLLKWSPDGHSITMLEGPPTKDFSSWVSVVAASGGGPVRPLMKDYSGTVIALGWTPDSRHLLAQSIEGTGQALLTIDVTTGAVRKLADVIQTIWEYSFSTNGQTIVYNAQTPESPSDIWVWTKDAGPRKITDFNPQTKSWRLGKVREVEWKNSKDGLIRRGVLITPPGYKAGNLYPTIVNTHPGDTAWWVGFHAKWWAWGQLLAANGYVVFLPNTRGVNGEGWRLHAELGYWGRRSFQDLMDGVDYLVEQKIADPNRLGIGGWSNGGFMTEYAITRSTRFKAAVAQAGHSDFFSLYGTSYLYAAMRVLNPDSPYYDRRSYDDDSPITLIRNCRTPTLLIHGINDSGVPVGQAYEFYRGLKDVGVETELVVYPREGHSIQEYGHQLDLQKRVVGWFNKHLKP
ncbi:MAG TPA: S9 family peptidase [Pyrinomonadaceae bacterium]|nr:S9 family peptidase [Pyrinomonadaceae bacterium]